MVLTVLARFREAINPTHDRATGSLWFGWSMALISTFSFSIAPSITRGAIVGGMNPTTLLAARLVISTLLLGGSIMVIAPQRLSIDRRGLAACGLGGLANGIGMLTMFWALARIHASIVSMFFSLSPLAALGLLALRGEKFTRRHMLRLGLGLGGVYLLVGPASVAAGGVDWVGLSLIFITILTFALHLVVIQWFLQGYDARTVTFYVVMTMTVVTVGRWLGEGSQWQNPGWSGWLAIGTLAVVSTYLARVALFIGVRYLGSGQIALLIPLETLLSILWSVLFLAERLTLWQGLGGLLILASALLAINRFNRTRWKPRWRVWARP
jgi:drug/metabolite transporter (DMT)-like permease